MVGASHPFDLVKVRMQTTSSPTAYTSTLHAARTILAKDGITGLYRGVVPVLIGTPPVLATCMWAYYQGQLLASKLGGRRRKLQLSDTNLTPALVNTLSLPQIGFAGAFSALPTSFILGPAEQIKIRLQVQEQGSKSASQVIKEIVKEGGPKALFRGTGLTLMRDVPGSFFYFLTYEGVKRACGADRSTSINPAVVLLSGGLAGMVNWTICIPIDTIKSRFQSARSEVGKSPSMMGVLRTTLADGGVAGLFRGLGPTLLRAFPASAAFFLGVEASGVVLDRIL